MTNNFYEKFEKMSYLELIRAEKEFCANPDNAFCCRACPIGYRRDWDDRFSQYGCSYGWCYVKGAVPKEMFSRHGKRRNKH